MLKTLNNWAIVIGHSERSKGLFFILERFYLNYRVAFLHPISHEIKELESQLFEMGARCILLTLSPKNLELAYWIRKQYWGKGYGTEATKALLEYGFTHKNLKRIFAISFTSSPGSWRVMEKVGLKHEGTLKQYVARFGQFYDLAYYGLLKEDFEKLN